VFADTWYIKGTVNFEMYSVAALPEKVKQLVAVDMQELKPYPKLNLSQTQTFCLHCSGSPL
jgi:hypothetical protein